MKLSLSLVAVLLVVALLQAASAAPQKKHNVSADINKGSGGKPVVNVKYDFNPNDRFKVYAGASHTIGGSTSYGAGLSFKFRRDVSQQLS